MRNGGLATAKPLVGVLQVPVRRTQDQLEVGDARLVARDAGLGRVELVEDLLGEVVVQVGEVETWRAASG